MEIFEAFEVDFQVPDDVPFKISVYRDLRRPPCAPLTPNYIKIININIKLINLVSLNL